MIQTRHLVSNSFMVDVEPMKTILKVWKNVSVFVLIRIQSKLSSEKVGLVTDEHVLVPN